MTSLVTEKNTDYVPLDFGAKKTSKILSLPNGSDVSVQSEPNVPPAPKAATLWQRFIAFMQGQSL